MAHTPKRAVSHANLAEQEIREQEVLRANRELAAFFRGRRTEREARAALKIIKAFIRDRERLDPAHRRPLPGAPSANATTKGKRSSPAIAKKARQRGRGRQNSPPPQDEAPSDATLLTNEVELPTGESNG